MTPFMEPFPYLEKKKNIYELHEGTGGFDASVGDVGLPED